MADKENDVDETRRLLYMAMISKGTKRYNLAGTIVNSLKHHHGYDIAVHPVYPSIASRELMEKVRQWVDGEVADDDNWLPELIATRFLGGE